MARGRPSKKQHIIDTALTLFSRLGYQGTSIDQVVIAAAVSKPTVYSNFSSKHILWTHSLESILATGEHELDVLTTNTLKMKTPQNTVLDTCLNHWFAIWEAWLASDNRLAVYRVMLGESHKMDDSSIALFQQFEAILTDKLFSSVVALSLSDVQKMLLMAISKDQLLMPLLYNKMNSTGEGNSQVIKMDELKKVFVKLLT